MSRSNRWLATRRQTSCYAGRTARRGFTPSPGPRESRLARFFFYFFYFFLLCASCYALVMRVGRCYARVVMRVGRCYARLLCAKGGGDAVCACITNLPLR